MSQRSTKDKILMVLKKRHELSMKELVTYFTISETAVRKQLNELLRQGFAQERIVKKEIGRPYYLYKLTSKGHEAFPNHNDQLPIQLLEDLKESEGEAAVSRLLKTRQVREAKELREVTPADSFKNKIEQLIAIRRKRVISLIWTKTKKGIFKLLIIIALSSILRQNMMLFARMKEKFTAIYFLIVKLFRMKICQQAGNVVNGR